MALSTATGIYNAPAGTGPDTFDGTAQGLTFTPKAVLFWWNLRTSTGTSVNFDTGYGFADSAAANHRQAMSISSEDGNTTETTQRSASNVRCIYHVDFGAVTRLDADLTAFTATGWTLNWATTTSGVDIHYFAWGGTDLTNTFVGLTNKSTNVSVPVTQSITGVGFQPDFVMLLLDDTTADSGTTANAVCQSIGIATSSSAQALVTSQHNNAGPNAGTNQSQLTNAIVHRHAGVTTVLGSLTSMDADGFTLSLTANSSLAYRLRYLCLKGGRYSVSSFNQGVATGNSATTGVGFKPQSELYFSWNRASSASIAQSTRISIGATDGTNQNCIWAGDLNAAAVMVCDQNSDATKTLNMITEGVAAAVTLNAACTFTSFNSDGRTLNWTTADATARQILAASFASATAVAPVISYFDDVFGFAGTSVTLTGLNFTGTTSITFNGTNAPTFTVLNSTTITVTVPLGATTGPIVVTNASGSGTSTNNYIIPTLTTKAVTENDIETVAWTAFTVPNESLIDGFQLQTSTSSQSGPWNVFDSFIPSERFTLYTVTLPSKYLRVVSYLSGTGQTSPVNDVFFLNTSAAPPPPPPPPPPPDPGGTPIALPSLFPFGAIVLTAGIVFNISDYFTGKFSSTITFCTHPLNSASALVYISDKTMLSTGSNAAITLLGPNQIFKLENRGGLSTLPLSNITLTTNITGSMILLSTQS